MIEFERKDFYSYDDLLRIMDCLRAPDGCPWDREQTHESIRRNFLEETYEALDAIERDNPSELCEELGDVLMQVVFHAQIEMERGRFTMADVVNRLCQKLVYRHPHVFGDVDVHGDSEQALATWEERKRQEHGQTTAADAIDSVPRTLPALWRAEKIHKRAAKAGFDWAEVPDALEKLTEELSELRKAIADGVPTDDPHGSRNEIGDLLFAVVKVAQMQEIDPEDALHRACDKFAARYRQTEALAERPLSECSIQELVALWQRAKESLPVGAKQANN